MAERSNAHDSKSCDAGMYPRVQIPFSAPYGNNTNSFSEFVLFFACDFFGAIIRLK